MMVFKRCKFLPLPLGWLTFVCDVIRHWVYSGHSGTVSIELEVSIRTIVSSRDDIGAPLVLMGMGTWLE